MKRTWRIFVLAIGVPVAVASLATIASATAPAAAPPTTALSSPVPIVTNDLLPDNNNLGNCVGTAESANCGSRARADGHTYLVFVALVLGLAFIFWRVARGVRARDAVGSPGP